MWKPSCLFCKVKNVFCVKKNVQMPSLYSILGAFLYCGFRRCVKHRICVEKENETLRKTWDLLRSVKSVIKYWKMKNENKKDIFVHVVTALVNTYQLCVVCKSRGASSCERTKMGLFTPGRKQKFLPLRIRWCEKGLQATRRLRRKHLPKTFKVWASTP